MPGTMTGPMFILCVIPGYPGIAGSIPRFPRIKNTPGNEFSINNDSSITCGMVCTVSELAGEFCTDLLSIFMEIILPDITKMRTC